MSELKLVDIDRTNIVGAMANRLKVSNKALKTERANQILAKLALIFRRAIEDMMNDLQNLKDERELMMDLNPGNTQVIINPGEFNAADFVKRDLELGRLIHNLNIQITDAVNRYNYLFSGELPATSEEELEKSNVE